MAFYLAVSSSSLGVVTGRPLASSRAAASTSMPLSLASASKTLPQRNRRALRPARASASDDDSQARRGTSASTSKTTATAVAEERPAPPKQQHESEKEATSQASSSSLTKTTSSSSSSKKKSRGFFGLGESLGPNGLTIGGSMNKDKQPRTGSGPIELGAIGMAVGASSDGPAQARVGREEEERSASSSSSYSSSPETEKERARRLSSLSTEEWRARYEPDGCVDLWVVEEFNAGSRLVGGRATHLLGPEAAGAGSGEGRVLERAGPVATHSVKIFNKATAQTVEVAVPENRYVLWEAEDQGLLLPYACRMGCCTACAVRVKSGEMSQPEALGVAAELRERGFALMCVGFARSDLILELAEEDEVYDLQFGDVFGERATDPSNAESIEKDPFALEVAFYDE